LLMSRHLQGRGKKLAYARRLLRDKEPRKLLLDKGLRKLAFARRLPRDKEPRKLLQGKERKLPRARELKQKSRHAFKPSKRD